MDLFPFLLPSFFFSSFVFCQVLVLCCFLVFSEQTRISDRFHSLCSASIVSLPSTMLIVALLVLFPELLHISTVLAVITAPCHRPPRIVSSTTHQYMGPTRLSVGRTCRSVFPTRRPMSSILDAVAAAAFADCFVVVCLIHLYFCCYLYFYCFLLLVIVSLCYIG